MRMPIDIIHDRGRGPEIVGTRITVYNLLPEFLDPTVTEQYLCQVYNLSPEQVAAARAYILNNPDEVLERHLEIEERIAAGNPPETVERGKYIRAIFLRFKKWQAEQAEAEARERAAEVTPGNDRSD